MKLFSTLILTLSFSTVFANTQQNPVVAEVNGHKIYKAELDNYYKNNLKNLSRKKVTKQSSLDDLINRMLGVEKAKQAGLDKDPSVIRRMEDILYHAQISKDLEKKLLAIGKVSDSEVKTYYKKNMEYRTAHILYRVRAVPTKEEVQKAYSDSLKTYDEVKKKP